jgi:hypothetical protein
LGKLISNQQKFRMSFIEDEEAFGVFDQQAEDNEAMPLEDLPQMLEMEEFGRTHESRS